MSDWYILNKDHTYRKASVVEYCQWDTDYEPESKKRVAMYESQDFTISTVFLGLDHSGGVGNPIVFETLVMGGDLDGNMNRYSTWEEAVEGHNRMIKECGGKVPKHKKSKNNKINSRFDILDL